MPQLSPEQLKELGLDTLADTVSEWVFKNALTELLNQLSDDEVTHFDAVVERAPDFESLATYLILEYPDFVSLLDKHQAAFIAACAGQLEATDTTTKLST